MSDKLTKTQLSLLNKIIKFEYDHGTSRYDELHFKIEGAGMGRCALREFVTGKLIESGFQRSTFQALQDKKHVGQTMFDGYYLKKGGSDD